MPGRPDSRLRPLAGVQRGRLGMLWTNRPVSTQGSGVGASGPVPVPVGSYEH